MRWTTLKPWIDQPHRVLIGLVLLLALGLTTSARAEVSHQAWDTLLRKHVQWLEGGHASVVDYAGMGRDRAALQAYLQTLTEVSEETFEQWSPEAQLAFLINAYNAFTVELILTRYPDLESIKDLGSLFRSPWKQAFFTLLGEPRSLDDVEHGLIRGSGRYNEPRIHFGVNCASIGCPALRPEAYVGAQLEAQLEDQARRFLSDRSRNRLEGDELQVSSIFKWFREDFESGWRESRRLADFLALYADSLGLSEADQARLKAGDVDIDFLTYDWGLNDVSKAESAR